MEESSKQLLKNFGKSKEYLSYIIKKENFKYIPIGLDKFDSEDLIYNQLTEKIILDCYGKMMK